MKIIKLKIKNINSLVGDNEIDFSQNIFTNEGIFAITGKTGSGKTSILDAITLALYGKTPRMGNIAGNENEVLTRGEKECWAEIEFEVSKKIWKSSWKQELNKQGKLKPVHRFIADKNNNIIADQIHACNTKIVEIIGLNFEQFTKVILLAQGNFTAFLQADKNDKGQLLEQITGTEIYGDISKKVFEQFKLEKEKMDRIKFELDTIKILSQEDLKQIWDEILILEQTSKALSNQKLTIETTKNWLLHLKKLENLISKNKTKLPELEQKLDEAQKLFLQSKKHYENVIHEKQSLEPVWNKVRELDTKLKLNENLLKPIHENIIELNHTCLNKNEILHKQNQDLDLALKDLNNKKSWQTQHIIYESVVIEYAALERENTLLLDTLQKINLQSNDILTWQNNLNYEKDLLKTAVDNFKINETNLKLKENELETHKQNYINILGGRELSQLQIEKDNITNMGIQIKNLIDLQSRIQDSRVMLNNIETKILAFEPQNNRILGTLTTLNTNKNNLEKNISLLQENIKLTQTIQSLESHRHHLKDGQACPLCGALEHPFAQANIPKIEASETELQDNKITLKDTLYKILELEKEHTQLVTESKNDTLNKIKVEADINDNVIKRNTLIASIKKIDFNFNFIENSLVLATLKQQLELKKNDYKHLTNLIDNATNISKHISQLRDLDIPKLQRDLQTAQNVKNETETRFKLTEQNILAQQNLLNDIKEEYNNADIEFKNKLRIYNVDNFRSLKHCLDAWNDNKNNIETLNNKVVAFKNAIAIITNDIKNSNELLHNKNLEKQTFLNEKQSLTDQRISLFAEKSISEDELRIAKQLREAETSKLNYEKTLHLNSTELEKLKAIITENEQEYNQLKTTNISDKNIIQIENEIIEITNRAEIVMQNLGAKKQVLDDHAIKNNQYQVKLEEKNKQQIIYNKWGELHQLIGSEDGKKYRNFAQALTFEQLIHISNKQLQKMATRYILKRMDDTLNPFDLAVIDTFQNNLERTAQNLSGGEKFIVSLALALGLANMASKNMTIDTMFIDEGFGTLDTDYLDVALNALANLQSEGKIIGVISHLTELKERIALHIDIVPNGQGHSKIIINEAQHH